MNRNATQDMNIDTKTLFLQFCIFAIQGLSRQMMDKESSYLRDYSLRKQTKNLFEQPIICDFPWNKAKKFIKTLVVFICSLSKFPIFKCCKMRDF